MLRDLEGLLREEEDEVAAAIGIAPLALEVGA
jgi:hypothetical protein